MSAADHAIDAPDLLLERVRAIAPRAARVRLTDHPEFGSREPVLTVYDQSGHVLSAPDVTYGGPDELTRWLLDNAPRTWPGVEYDVDARVLKPTR